VHVDDLADAYVRAAESGLQREIFNVADRSRETVTAMVTAAAQAAEFQGALRYLTVAEAAKTMGNFAECLTLDQHLDTGKAGRLLNWQPRHNGFSDQARIYFEAWMASQ
jgi:nucleoside-diphosphate-sugar epimerase